MVGTSVDRNPRTPQAGQGGNPWVKETVIGDEEGSCYNSNYYKNTNVVLGEQTGNINHSGDYYVCADKEEDAGKCKIVSYDEWITTVKNCKKDPNSKDPCYNMATNSTPGVSDFHMGACSTSQEVYNPENNTGGADGCALSADGTTPDAHDEDDDYETCMRETGNKSQWCGIGPVNGVRPAYPTAKGILAKVGNRSGSDGMDGSGYTSGDQPLDGSWNDPGDLNSCPSTVNVSLSCYGDGYGGAGAEGNAPGCGMGDDAKPEGSVRLCKRPTSDYEDDNITKCCLGVSGKAVGPDGDTSSSFKSCPVGYCRSEVRLDDLRPEQFCEGPVSASKGADGELVCYMMSDKCNDHFDGLCDADAFIDTANKNHGYCNTWALAMPQRFEGIASEVCSIPEPEGEEEIDISNDSNAQNRLRKIFTNKLCREWIIRNYETNISKIREICKHAVRDKGIRDDGYNLGWELTPLGEKLKDICPCHYPDEYYEWYKNDKFNKGEVQSNLGAQIKPECFSPECQRTLLYPTTENPDCPALQICRQSIENNIVSVGERASDSRLGKSSSGMKLPGKIDSQVCNFSNTQAGYNPPPIPTPDGYSGGPDGIFGGSEASGGGGSNNSSGRGNRGGRPKWDDEEEEGDNTMLLVGVTSVVLIFMVIIIVLMMRRQ